MDLSNSEDDSNFTETDFDSEIDDCDSDHQRTERSDKVESLLKFAENISRQVTSYFRRNADKDDFCDVYEDKFSAPKSGSYSYYTDLLAVAQIGDNREESSSQTTRVTGEDVPCNWTCTGYRNEALGAGPLEDLFRVLDVIPGTSKTVDLCHEPEKDAADCIHQKCDLSILSSSSAFYSATDSFTRWSNSFPQHLPSALEDFHTFDESTYLNH